MNWVADNPTPLVLAAVLVAALLGVVYTQTRRKEALAAIFVVLLLGGCVVLLAMSVTTERERVESRLTGLAAALESNDTERVLSFIAPSAARVRSVVEMRLPTVTITEAKVGSNLEITILPEEQPPTAYADFTGKIRATSPIFSGDALYARRFRMEFHLLDEEWYLAEYEDRPLVGNQPAFGGSAP